MSTHHLAQINIARLIAPLEDPTITEFTVQLETINKLAEASPGFIWRLQSDEAYNDDPLIVANLSLWKSIEALKAFTYESQHLQAFQNRKKWFHKMEVPHCCLWWVPLAHRPAMTEGRARLQLYQCSGSSPEAFWFSEPYPAPSPELIPA
jgi:heme-degrading monooxygenase HmoA